MNLNRLLVLGLACFLASPTIALAQQKQSGSTLSDLQSTIQRAADKVSPSLVLIYVDKRKAEKAVSPLLRRRLGSFGNTAEGYYQRPTGPVVGVVYDDKGTILTSIYNVRGSTGKIWVVAADGKKREATLLGKDGNLDIQALKVKDHKGLVPAKVTSSKSLRPGQFVILAAPSETGRNTTTFGIVSALGRKRRQAIQMSARVNYGNNGGAVVNKSGELVAISAFHSNAEPTGQNSGVGFAAPTDLINKSLATIVSGKDVDEIPYPFLGIQVGQGQNRRQRPTNSDKKEGVRISKVQPNTAAERAGIKDNDVIKIFNGVEIEDFVMLVEEIRKLRVGDEILITISRDGWGEKEFTVKLGKRPKDVR